MHTMIVRVGKVTSEGISNEAVSICHNSDWSGDALVSWQENGLTKEVAIPGRILQAIGREAALELFKDKVVAFLEQL